MEEYSLPVFYVHLPSSGGTTFWSILREVYGGRNIERVIQDEEKQVEFDAIKDAAARFSNKAAIGGHIHYALAMKKCPERQMITFLRNPIERAISVYTRKIRNGKWKPSTQRGQYDLVDYWACNNHFAQLSRYYTFLENGDVAKGSIYAVPETTAEEIVDTLVTRFSSFGILEEYNKSLLLMGETLGWRDVPTYDKRNVAVNRPAVIEEGVKEQLSELLAVDMDVYFQAYAIYTDRWSEANAAKHPSILKTYEKANQARHDEFLNRNSRRNPFSKHPKKESTQEKIG